MKYLFTAAILMVLFVAGNAFAGGPPNPPSQVPEPNTLLMMASGAASIGGIALWRWRKK